MKPSICLVTFLNYFCKICILCWVWSVKSLFCYLTVRQSPNRGFLEYLSPIRKETNKQKRCCSVFLSYFNRCYPECCFSQRSWNNGQHLCRPLSYSSRQNKTHNPIFGGQNLLPSLAPASTPERQTIFSMATCLEAREWGKVVATQTPKFTRPFLYQALPWIQQGFDSIPEFQNS